MSDLVVMSLELWDGVWRRNQHLVSGLMNELPSLRVLFVEPAADPLFALTQRRRPQVGHSVQPVSDPYVGTGHPRLWSYRPSKWLPRRLDGRTDQRLANGVRRAARRLDMVSPALWVNDPAGAHVMAGTGWPTLYDITDDWLLADRGSTETARVQAQEGALLREAVEIVVCSAALARSKGSRRQVHLIPNAVDLADLRSPRPRPEDLPDGRCAVYVGTVHTDRIDLDLCVRTARQLDGSAHVVLVGPALLSASNRALLEGAGVVVLGPRPRALVAGYLQHADVLLVPHLVDDFTDSLDPIKAYEYQAVGVPVVSTAVAGFREGRSSRVHVVGAGTFASTVERVLHDGPADHAGLEPVPDWSDRVRSFAPVLRHVLVRAGSSPS